LYPDSSGAMVAPPKVEMLVGGKRKEGSKPTRCKKKSKKK